VADPSNYASVITSESLQKKFRDTFPSQVGQGLGGDLLASGVVVPTVDFSGAITGSSTLPTNLQQAFSHGSITSTTTTNSTATLTSTPGFYKLEITVSCMGAQDTEEAYIALVNSTTKKLNNWRFTQNSSSAMFNVPNNIEHFVFLGTGDSLVQSAGGQRISITTCFQQIADSVGNLILPSGFTPE
jgi:hypothetical protein